MSKQMSMLIGLTLFLSALIAVTGTAQQTYQGLLGETVEMTSFIGSDIESIDLYETPREALTATPEGESIRYGVIRLGNGVDTRISVAIRMGENPLLWIDANNNEDLFDDAAPTPDSSSSPNSFTWYREVTVTYWEDGIHSTAPYILRISVMRFRHLWSGNEWDVIYSGFCARKGLIQIDSQLHTIWLSDSDSDGLFNDLTELTVMIDNDGNGTIDQSYQSPESFTHEIPFMDQGLVQIGDSLYRVTDASADGRLLTLAAAETDIEPLLTLQVGYPAPLQTASTMVGDLVNLADYLGQPLLLLFAPLYQLFPEYLGDCPPQDGSWLTTFCSVPTCPTSGGASRALQRTQALIMSLGDWDEELDFGVVLVASDPMFPDDYLDFEATADQLSLPFPVLWDDAMAFRYRSGLYDAIIIGSDGIIVARDGLSTIYDAAGRVVRVELAPLSASRIGDLLFQLSDLDN